MRRCTMIALCATLAGCLDFNLDCPPDNTEVVGRTETLLDLRHSFLRTREAPVGNMIADAFYDHMRPQFQPDDLVIAIINTGSIRDRNDCRVTEFIDRGPVTLGQVADMLPFDNNVVVAEVAERDLWRMLEHAVARLGDPGEGGLAGQFLQVSHLEFAVDCDLRAAVDDEQLGLRVTRIQIRDADGNLGTALDRADLTSTRRYKVVTNSFLAEGGDGYVDMFAKQPLPEDIERADFLVVANYIADRTPVTPTTEGRINLESNCVLEP